MQDKHASLWDRLAGWLLSVLLIAPFIAFGVDVATPQAALAAVIACPAGHHRDPASGACVVNTGATPLTCPAGEKPGPAGKKCVPIPHATGLCGGNAVAMNGVCSCPKGMNGRKDARGVLQCIPQIACPADEHPDVNGACVASRPEPKPISCPAGEKPGPAGKACIQIPHLTGLCSGNAVAINGACACPKGMTGRKDARGVLQCIPQIACPAGEHPDVNGACVANRPEPKPITCPAGKKPGPAGKACIKA